MRGTKQTASGPSQRQLRVAELIRHALADILSRHEVEDPVLSAHIVTVPEVRMSPDLKIATCYVMPLGGKDIDAVVAALEKNRKPLRLAVSQRSRDMKFSPDLRFRRDESFDEAARIDALLDSDVVRRDTQAGRFHLKSDET